MGAGSTESVDQVGRATGPAVGLVINNLPIFAIVLLWQLAGMTVGLPYYLPTPVAIASAMWSSTMSGDLVRHASASLKLAYAGFFIGGAAGVLLGVITGRSKLLTELIDPFITVTYPVPKIALFPLFIIWLGLGFGSKAMVVILTSFYPIYINSFEGARNIKTHFIWSSENFNASQFQLFGRVVLPASLPQIFSGLRVGLALAFIVLFSAELIQSDAGLGFLVNLAKRGQNYDLMFAAITTIALLGFVHDRVLLAIRRRLLAWQEGDIE